MSSNKHCTQCTEEIQDRRKNKVFCGEPCREAYIESLVEKTCTGCSEVKPVSEYGRAVQSFDRLSHRCKQCVREAWERWYYKNDSAKIENAKANRRLYAKADQKDRLHAKRLARYDLTDTEFGALVDRSGGLCEICKRNPFEVIDHCHSSGKVRGLLCGGCNRSLGGFRDSIDILTNAVEYVKMYGI